MKCRFLHVVLAVLAVAVASCFATQSEAACRRPMLRVLTAPARVVLKAVKRVRDCERCHGHECPGGCCH